MDRREPATHSTVLLCGDSGLLTDAIQQYAGELSEAMNRRGDACRVEVIEPLLRRRSPRRWSLGIAKDQPTVVVVQYNPFSYGRLGLAPGLIARIAHIRLTRPVRVAVMCHETFTMAPGGRWRLVRQLHRIQLAALFAMSHAVFVSVGAWIPVVRALGARAPIRLPVGSNLPDRRANRSGVRASLAIEDALVVTSFSTGHPAHLDEYLVAAIEAVVERRPEAVVLTLGAGRRPIMPAGSPVREIAPGFLEADELAGMLAASDLFISPYVDGVSTRRGTVMAALQHGVAVVGTRGAATDADLEAHLAHYGAPSADGVGPLRTAAVALATDEKARTEHAGAGRALYVSSYDWDVVARELSAAIGGGSLARPAKPLDA